MPTRYLIFFLTTLLNTTFVFSQTNNVHSIEDRIPISKHAGNSNAIYVIEKNIKPTLHETIMMPTNSVLRFNGGVIDKATIVGDQTKIEAGLCKIFGDDVMLEGSWDVKEAYPEWFGAKADEITDETYYVQKVLSLRSPFVVISRQTRFNLRDLILPKNTYLIYFADSEIGTPHGTKRKSGELVIYSANSSYPEQSSGGEVNEIRFEGQLHPAIIADIRKDVEGHNSYIAPNQRDSIARVSFQIEDEEIPRASFHYKSNYRGFDLSSGTQIQANRTRIILTGVGSENWKKSPNMYNLITQKDKNNKVIAGGFVLNQDNNSTTLSWLFGKFEKGLPLFYDSQKSRTVVNGERRIDEGLAALNTTNYKHGWAIGIPASISDAMFTVGGRIYSANTDMYGNDFRISEPGIGFRYYTGLTDYSPRERTFVLDKNESAYRRVVIRNEKEDNLGMVGACSAFSKLFVHKGKLVRSSNSYNVDSVVKQNGRTGEYYVKFVTPLQSAGYCVSLTTNNPLIYGCVSNESKEGFTIELFIIGTSQKIDIEKGSIHMACFGGDL